MKIKTDFIRWITVDEYYDVHEYEGHPVWSSGLLRQALGHKGMTEERAEELRRQLVTDKGHALELILDQAANIDWRKNMVILDGPLNTAGSRMVDAWQEGLSDEEWFQRYYAIECEHNKRRTESTARKWFDEHKEKVLTYIEARKKDMIVVDAADMEWISGRVGMLEHRYPWAFCKALDQHGILFKVTITDGEEVTTAYGKALIDRVTDETPDGDRNSYAIIDFKASGLAANQWPSVMRRQGIAYQLSWYMMAFKAAHGTQASAYVIFVGDGWDKAVRISTTTIKKCIFGYDTELRSWVNGEEVVQRRHTRGIVDVLTRKINTIDEY